MKLGCSFQNICNIIPFSKLCLALGLSVSWLGDLCLALGLSVICWNYVRHWVCLLFVGIMLGIGFACLLGG